MLRWRARVSSRQPSVRDATADIAARGSRRGVSTIGPLIAKGLAGGALVVTFALLSEALRPKRFAGLFGAAPAVAIAGLTVTVLTKGAGEARDASIGMIAGCAGLIAYAVAAVLLLKRVRPLVASGLALSVWAAVAVTLAQGLM